MVRPRQQAARGGPRRGRVGRGVALQEPRSRPGRRLSRAGSARRRPRAVGTAAGLPAALPRGDNAAAFRPEGLRVHARQRKDPHHAARAEAARPAVRRACPPDPDPARHRRGPHAEPALSGRPLDQPAARPDGHHQRRRPGRAVDARPEPTGPPLRDHFHDDDAAGQPGGEPGARGPLDGTGSEGPRGDSWGAFLRAGHEVGGAARSRDRAHAAPVAAGPRPVRLADPPHGRRSRRPRRSAGPALERAIRLRVHPAAGLPRESSASSWPRSCKPGPDSCASRRKTAGSCWIRDRRRSGAGWSARTRSPASGIRFAPVWSRFLASVLFSGLPNRRLRRFGRAS